ncbi:hypothetical protein JL720_17104 [Aureococcus anophagefferens]|nr:hypothetical protein JL720_17104 [Aureococcus anophagefferens]
MRSFSSRRVSPAATMRSTPGGDAASPCSLSRRRCELALQLAADAAGIVGDESKALPAIRAVAAHYEGEVEVRVRLAPLSDIDGDFDLAWGLHAVKLASPEVLGLFLPRLRRAAGVQDGLGPEHVRERAAYQAEHFAAKVGANVAAFSAQLAPPATRARMPAAFWNAKAEWKRTVLRGVYGTPSFALNGIAIPEIGDAGSGLAHLAAAHWIAAIDQTLAFSPWNRSVVWMTKKTGSAGAPDVNISPVQPGSHMAS